jgi:hypothetical protein
VSINCAAVPTAMAQQYGYENPWESAECATYHTIKSIAGMRPYGHSSCSRDTSICNRLQLRLATVMLLGHTY